MRPRGRRPQPAEQWRAGLLADAGLSPALARSIGADLRYDVHQLLGLLEQGCPESLALRIVAPDDALPLARQHGSEASS